jgi:hypothetical protein
LKVVLDNAAFEQVRNFNYLGCCIGYEADNDVNLKLHRFQQSFGTIKHISREIPKADVIKIL